MQGVKFIDEVEIKNKKVFLRVDFNVSLNPNYTVADDARITQTLPTIQYLLKNKNRLIIVSGLNRPKKRDPKLSLNVVAKKLHSYLPAYKVSVVNDFLTDSSPLEKQKENEVLFLENIRFYPEEKKNDQGFAKKLASLADLYVNDAFGVCHRTEASIVSVPKFLPAYGGLLLKKEITTISQSIRKPKKPFVAIIGGAKIETKINMIDKLTEIADYILVGGGLANTFLYAHGYEIGNSYYEYKKVAQAKHLLFLAAQKHTEIVLPSDVIIGNPNNTEDVGVVRRSNDIPKDARILDIGPDTQAKFGAIIAKAKTIIWNGPVGFIENPVYKRGTDFIYYSIAQNTSSTSIVGGGDTLAAISKKEYLDKITHISTGGGAMLEFIEKGTLPGIEALKK